MCVLVFCHVLVMIVISAAEKVNPADKTDGCAQAAALADKF